MSVRLTKHGRYASTQYPSTSNESDSSNSTDTFRSKSGQSYTREHDYQSLGSPSMNTPTSIYRAKSAAKTVFSTSSSIESLQDYNHQQHQAATTAELLNENLILVQKNALAQQEVNSARNNQARLENQVYELDQSLAEARKEAQRLLRAKKDSERQLDQSNAAFERERTQWLEREAELVRSLKFATRPLVVQAPAKEDRNDIEKEPMDALPPQIQQQIAETNAAQTRALRSQEKIAAELRRQILALNQDLIERQHNFDLRESELQGEITQARELNKGLMEENESYQLLLHEKSMNGEFMQTSIMKSTGYDEQSVNGSANLADELGRAFGPTPSEERTTESLNEENITLKEEIKKLKDHNTALGLYIAKILTRIMERPGFTSVLASDYTPAPAPPSVVRNSGTASGSRGSDNDSKEEEKVQAPKKEVQGRARSQSFLQSLWAPRPKLTPPPTSSGKSSARNSSEDDSSSGVSTKMSSFQEGHSLEDSPRASYSSTELAAVGIDQPLAPEEELTTFANPFPRKELQRHASIGAHERQRRRQTIGAPNAAHLKGGHGRYVSESSAAPSSHGRRSMVPPSSKNNISILPPMPEFNHKFSPISESFGDQFQSSDSMESTSPALSISTSGSSASNPSTGATPTTPVVAEAADGGILRKFRRFSMFGATNPVDSSSGSVETGDTRQQFLPAVIAENASESA
ncbi:hypothetical protein BGX21_008060 [Mortierella sp. AD011]|nr:hypothetical protein BGX20_011331 [Mortierella sp. AD010]KAF9398216.1 hypothetical protein BGX21_008060 [Mortierella sp. AD011]